jgi:elongator complex protein 4
VSSGGGENNLAFKCMRRRMLFETLHLDLEGGVGERRTTPTTNALTPARDRETETRGKAEAAIKVMIEEGSEKKNGDKVKIKKRVGFKSDRPDLYDF